MRRSIFALAMIVVACESDEKKLDRLKSAKADAFLTELRYRQIYDSLSKSLPSDSTSVQPATIEAYRDSMLRAQTKLDLAQRDIDRFLR